MSTIAATTPEPLPRPQAPVLKGPRQARAALLKSRQVRQSLLGAAFPLLLAVGWRYPLVGYFIPLCMVLGLSVALFQGRSWCNWLCPRGSFEDAWLARISRNRPIPPVFRGMPFRVGVLLFLFGMLTWQFLHRWPDPYAIGAFFVLLLTLTSAVAVLLGILVHQRTWCYLCPIGTLSYWVGKTRRPLRLKAEHCRSCHLCTRACPMQLNPVELKETAFMRNGGDCLKCSLCVASCPQGALTFTAAGLPRGEASCGS